MKQSILACFLLSLLITLASSCKEDEEGYQPNLNTVNDLVYEYSNLNLTVSESISRLDTCTSLSIFNYNFDVFNQNREKINILIADAETKRTDSTLSSGEQSQLSETYRSMLATKERWFALSTQLTEIKSQEIQLLLAFNTIKQFLFQPTYDSEASLDEIYQSHLVFRDHPSATGLLYFQNREDLSYILDFAENVRDIEKIYEFYFYAIKTYDLRLLPSSYELYVDRLKLQLAAIQHINNKSDWYNLYIKNRINLSNSKQTFELSELIYFAENIENAENLLSSYLAIQAYVNIFENDNDEFIKVTDSLAQYASRIELIETHDSLFNSFFGDTYTDFTQLIFFSNNAEALALWKKDYLDIVEQIETLFNQYKDAAEINNETDKELVLALAQKRTTLIQLYDDHFMGYKDFLQDFSTDLQTFLTTQSTGEKLEFLVDLID